MRLRIVPGRDVQTLILKGELDLASAGQLVDAVDLCSFPEGDTILDCSALSFLDAAGAHAIVSIAEDLPMGSKLVLRGANGVALRVLQMLRVDRHPRIDIEP